MISLPLVKWLFAAGLFCVAVAGQEPGPPLELAKNIQSRLKPQADSDDAFSFGVLSDPHIYYGQYKWQHASLRAWNRGNLVSGQPVVNENWRDDPNLVYFNPLAIVAPPDGTFGTMSMGELT